MVEEDGNFLLVVYEMLDYSDILEILDWFFLHMRCWIELTDVLVEEIIEKVNDTNAASSFPDEQDRGYKTWKDCALFSVNDAIVAWILWILYSDVDADLV